MAKRVSKLKLLNLTDGRCYLCGDTVNENTVIIEHIHPRSRGGSDRVSNLAPSCNSCNRKKGSFLLSELKERILNKVPICKYGPVFYYEHKGINIQGVING